VKASALRRDIDFAISIKDAWRLFCEQDGICPYNGLPLSFGPDQTASLDRKDSAVGYVEGNVHWVHKVVNRMKWKLPENDFLRLVYLVCNPVDYGFSFEVRRRHNPKWTGCGNFPTWLVGRFKDIARRRGIPFGEDVDARYLWHLCVVQRQACVLTGIPIDFPRHSYARKQATASLDRIDSSQGYVRGNLQWVHKDVNNMKGSLSDEELREMCRRILDYSPLLAELSEGRAA